MSTPSVLIFDRDAHSGSSLRDLVATWGYYPIVADDIPAALRAVDELKPAVILDGGPVQAGSVLACSPALHEPFLDLLGALGPPS